MVAVKEVETDSEKGLNSPTTKKPRNPFEFTEDGHPDWKNKAYDIFKEKVGEELYVRLRRLELEEAKQYEEDAGFISALGDILQQVKTDLFSPTSALVKRDTGVYPLPVGGCGFAKIASVPRFPEHPFFQANRIFRARLRHNNLSEEDDAGLDGRVVSLRLEGEGKGGGRLDLIMYTGQVPPYQNADNFGEFIDTAKRGSDAMMQWVYKKPTHQYAMVDMMRRKPDSFYDQRYHSHVSYVFEGSEGEKVYARLRLLPADGRPETGLPDDQDQAEPWASERRDDETCDTDYLRKEYRARLRRTPIQYRLQIQLHSMKSEPANILSPLNPWGRWKSNESPWQELAVVSITTSVTERSIAGTVFNLKNHPASFRLPETRSLKDFASLGGVLREFHGVRDDSALYTDTEDTKVKYKVKVITGKVMGAGTDADVFITMTGDETRTPSLELSSSFHDDFEPGQADEFELSCVGVGRMMCVDMNISSVLAARKWYLEEVVVMEEGGDTARFPCYQWLTYYQPSVTLRPANALAPQRELSLYPYLQRKYEIFRKRYQYRWEKVHGLPGRISAKGYLDLPEEAKFQMEKDMDLTQKYLRTLANSGAGNVLVLIGFWDIIDDNPKLLTKFLKQKAVVKSVIKNWRSDEEFGRQVLNGPHPTRIKRATYIPHVFTRHRTTIESHLERGITLDEEIQAGHIYYLEYPELENMKKSKMYKTKYKRYVTAPTCLLYVRESGALVPVAVCLGDPGTVWTPGDSPEDWLYAKMWVREADAQVHQVVSRHLHTHLFMETVAVATVRNLSSAHPVYKLLLPHLRYTLAVNTLGREHMYPAEVGLFQKYLAVGGQHQKLLKNAYKNFHLDELNVPKNLAARGVGDAEALPGYHYRDDARRLWRVMSKFVRTVLMLHYWQDEAVRADEEVQDWIQDLWENGLPVWRDEVPEEGDGSDTDSTEVTKSADTRTNGDKADAEEKNVEVTQDTKTEDVLAGAASKAGDLLDKYSPSASYWTDQLNMKGKKKPTLQEMAKEYKKENPEGAEDPLSTLTTPTATPQLRRKDMSGFSTNPTLASLPQGTIQNSATSNILSNPNNKPSIPNNKPSIPNTKSSNPTSLAVAPITHSDDSPQVYYDSDFEDFQDHGVPKYFEGLEDLTEFITTVMFTASCQHAALTFGSMDYYGYVPNAPTMLLSPPPTEKGKITMNDIKKALPSKGKTAEIIAAFYTLSNAGSDEVFLSQFPEKYFDDEAVSATILAFQEDLKNVTNEMEERNKTLDIPYTYMMPDRVPKSVSM